MRRLGLIIAAITYTVHETAIAQQLKAEPHKVAAIDWAGKTVKYSTEFKCHRDLNILTGDEEVVRAGILNRLVNQLHYRASFIELEKTYRRRVLGRKKGKEEDAGRIDILVKDEHNDPFYFIELKDPLKWDGDKHDIEGQLFGLAEEEQKQHKTKVKYLVYYTIDEQDGVLRDKCWIIDFQKYPTYASWDEAGQPLAGNELLPGYEKPQKKPLVKGDPTHDLRTNINRAEISKLATSLHNVLWGGGGTNDSDIFYSLVNIILAKIQDESERADDEEYQFQVLGHEDHPESDNSVYERINELYRRALKEKLHVTNERDLSHSFVINTQKFPTTKLRQAVEKLQVYSFLEGRNSLDGRDILGDFFEQITREGFKQTKGQFFTPSNVIKFLLYSLQVDNLAVQKLNKDQELPYIIDPSLGSGAFLIEAMKLITKEVKYKRVNDIVKSRRVQDRYDELFVPDHKENKWARDYLYGTEINSDLGTASKVNMILHGDGATNIFVKDGLLPFRRYEKTATPNYLQTAIADSFYNDKDVNGQFDIVISNPPFSVALDDETKRSLSSSFLFGNKKNSENLFLERYYQLLKSGGRLGVVLPESVFDTSENKYVRLFLFKYFNIMAVVSLPQVTFEPYTSTKTSILLAQKKSTTQIKIWNAAWQEASNEWARLNTRIDNYQKVYLEGADILRFPSIKDHNLAEAITNVTLFLKEYLTDLDRDTLTLEEILRKYSTEIKEVSSYDKDLVDYFGHANAGWVFGEVAAKLGIDSNIFMAEAEHVGYKRTKRGEKLQPNDLYDIEIAPLYLDYSAVLSGFNDAILKSNEELDNGLDEQKDIISSHASKPTPNKADKITNLEEIIARLHSNKALAEINIKTIEAFLIEYYEPSLKRPGFWQLKPEFLERSQKALKIHFESGGLLYSFRSEDVLLRTKGKVKILDFIRQDVVWHS